MLSVKDFLRFYGFSAFLLILATVFIASYSYESPSRKFLKTRELLGSNFYVNCIEKNLNCEITAYCPEKCCNTRIIRKKGRSRIIDWSDQVAVGQMSIRTLHQSGIDIVAVDPDVIPHGSIIYYNHKYYIALDTGGAIKGDRIDLSMRNHNSTIAFGRRFDQEVKIYTPENPGSVVRYLKKYFSNRKIVREKDI